MRAGPRPKALIGAWLDFLSPAQRELALALRHQVRLAAPDLPEGLRWGQLVFLWGGSPLLAIAPGHGQMVLLVYNGHLLPPRLLMPEPGAAPSAMRSLRCRVQQPLDIARIQEVVRLACQRALEFGHGRARGTGAPED